MAMAEVLVDSTIAVVIFGSLYEGYRRGLMTSLLGLVGFASVLLLCIFFGELLSKPLKPLVPLPSTYSALVAYVGICFVISLVAYFVQGFFSKLLTKRVPPALDAIGGIVVGALRGGVFMALCLIVLVLIANPIINEKIGKDSRIGAAFFNEVRKVSPTVDEIFTAQMSPLSAKRVLKGESQYEEALSSFEKKGEKNK